MAIRPALSTYFESRFPSANHRIRVNKPQTTKEPDSLEKLRRDLEGVTDEDERAKILQGRYYLISPYAGNGLG